MDVDMAEEMTHYTTSQVLTQAGTSMLAQANERPSQVLQLLQ
jgi:flagellin